jgi:hypothetical protein
MNMLMAVARCTMCRTLGLDLAGASCYTVLLHVVVSLRHGHGFNVPIWLGILAMPTCHALLQGCVVVPAVAAGRDLGADLQRCLFGQLIKSISRQVGLELSVICNLR